jgi:hypothetical protein
VFAQQPVSADSPAASHAMGLAARFDRVLTTSAIPPKAPRSAAGPAMRHVMNVVVKIRARAPILWYSTASFPAHWGAGAVFAFGRV